MKHLSWAKYVSASLIAATAVLLIGLQSDAGWIVLGTGLATLPFCDRQFRRDIGLIYGTLAVLGITPITTSTGSPQAAIMGAALGVVVLVPYLLTRFVYKNNLVRFPLRASRTWTQREIVWVFVAIGVAYLLLPPMLRSGGSYLNWQFQPDTLSLLEAYIGLNVVGIWDELFFISTVLGILRAHFDFRVANLVQAVVFTSFLFTLGFQGWAFIPIFIFALSQGYIFKKTESLLYILTIHLSIDLLLHFVLVDLNYPGLAPFFIT